MKKQTNISPGKTKDEKTDLKHDSMEFSASTDGEDKLDIDDEHYEEEGITAEELDIMEEDEPDNQAIAMNAVETDRLADEDNLPEEDWTDDLPDEAADHRNDEAE